MTPSQRNEPVARGLSAEPDFRNWARACEAETFRFEDDGIIPNHPRWPLILYEGAVGLPPEFDPAAVFERLFECHGWGRSWRNGVYPFAHYHSGVHEALGVARGSAEVRFGGASGRVVSIKAGDVAILPAGTGHQCISASLDFLVVGAYPPEGAYDLCRTAGDREMALPAILRVGPPHQDPVFGEKGALMQLRAPGRS